MFYHKSGRLPAYPCDIPPGVNSGHARVVVCGTSILSPLRLRLRRIDAETVNPEGIRGGIDIRDVRIHQASVRKLGEGLPGGSSERRLGFEECAGSANSRPGEG